jgi:hypothetical protein
MMVMLLNYGFRVSQQGGYRLDGVASRQQFGGEGMPEQVRVDSAILPNQTADAGLAGNRQPPKPMLGNDTFTVFHVVRIFIQLGLESWESTTESLGSVRVGYC